MKNKVGWLIVFSTVILACSSLSSLFAPKYEPAPYARTTGSASPGKETQISLDDGASISIPEESINGEVSVTVERNPDKAKTLPPLPEGFVQVGDFYNFEITSGELIGPVDLTLPFDEKLIPSGDGILMMAVPTDNGWEFKPVEEKDGKATTYTMKLGDPLITWHFAEPNQMNMCDSGSISVSTVPTGEQDKYEIVGRVAAKKASLLDPVVILGGHTIDIEVRSLFGETSRNFSVLTKNDGTFSVKLDLSNIPEKNRSVASPFRIAAILQCKPKITRGYTFITTIEGYDSIYIYPATAEQPAPPQPIQPPVAQSQPITPPQSPTDKIPVPNVVGMTFEDAEKTLEDLGFNTTWIDGRSNLELGKIYSQAPNAGMLSVPHRTTVVIYRTIETVAVQSEYGCDNPSLSKAELANCGSQTYTITVESFIHDCNDSFTSSPGPKGHTFKFPLENQEKIDTNTYGDGYQSNVGYSRVFTFNEKGFVIETRTSLGNLSCRFTWTLIDN